MTDRIGSNDVMPSPGVVRSVHLDRAHHLCTEALLLQRKTWKLCEMAYTMTICGTFAGAAVTIGAVLNHAWPRAAAMATWTLGTGAICAVLMRFAFKGWDLIKRLEKNLTEWSTEEVHRRLDGSD